MNKTVLSIAIVVIIAAGIGVVIYMNQAPAPQPESTGTYGTTPTPMPTPAPSATPPPPQASGSEISTKEFTVTGQSFSFTPSTMTVNQGDHVKITFKSVGGTHDFKIDEFNVATNRIGTGGEATVEFTADKKGTFEYYCSVGNHRAMGMKGTLIVQ